MWEKDGGEMTREEVIAAIKAKCHYCECFPKCVHDRPECFKASEMAIKSLEAWDAVKKDLADMWLEGYSPYTEVMEIIDRHLKEVEE